MDSLTTLVAANQEEISALSAKLSMARDQADTASRRADAETSHHRDIGTSVPRARAHDGGACPSPPPPAAHTPRRTCVRAWSGGPVRYSESEAERASLTRGNDRTIHFFSNPPTHTDRYDEG